MRIRDFVSRSAGLTRLAIAKVALGRRISFHAIQNVSPFIHIFIGPSARLTLGRNTTMESGVDIRAVASGVISIAENVYLGPRCMLSAHAGITIGAHTLLGPDVKIFDNNHEFAQHIGVVPGKHRSAAVRIGANCWLGANVVILKGVTVGDGSVIGAGCVIKRDIPPFSLATQDVNTLIVPIGAPRT